MSIKEVIDLLNDLKESHKQIALRLKLLELEIIYIKENIPGKITSMIEKTEKFDKKVSQNYLKELLAKKVASKSSYQKGSMVLGCLNYAGEFISELAKKGNLLQKLIRKSNRLGWTEEHTQCIKKLKEECAKLPKLSLPEETDNLVLQTDASDYHWGALLQTDLNEICRYTSGTFNDAETRYSTNEKELLAIVRGIRKFSTFLLPKNFVIRTDNTQVSGLIFNKLPSEPQYRRLHRWKVLLSFYTFTIEYIKGSDNFLADFIFRNVEYGQSDKNPDKQDI